VDDEVSLSNRVEAGVLASRTTAIAFVAIFTSALAFGCSCSNSTPIQQTSERYRERAVFTARIVQLVGRTYNWDGKKSSSLALAVVHHRYWGLPWYWPKVVLLDGSYPCDMVMTQGEEYLVSGMRWRYGVLGVNGCSRTQPLKTAQLDLRTIDGSHCASPGGTIIGHLLEWAEVWRDRLPARNTSLTFRDEEGKPHVARTDDGGLYELQHLPPGRYRLDSLFGSNEYASSTTISVSAGLCIEATIGLRDYGFFAQLPAGIGKEVSMTLVETGGKQAEIRSDSIEPDGKVYFRNVPNGRYLLVLSTWQQGPGVSFYYPGTYDRRKATLITVSDHAYTGPLEFRPDRLPLVAVPVTLNPSVNLDRFDWRVRLIKTNEYIVAEEKWMPGYTTVELFGLRGVSYVLGLYGFSKHPMDYGDCWSSQSTLSRLTLD
jgi:hypothetical protein